MNPLRPTLVFLSLCLPFALSACDTSDRESDEEITVFIGAEQEERMCSTIASTATSTVSLKTAGSAIDQCGAMGPTGGLNEVTLADFEGENGGYLEVLLSADGLAPVYLMIKEEVDAEVLDGNGEPVSTPDVDHEIDPCPDASGKFVWIPETASSFVRFGPTGLTKIHVLAEIVEE